VRRPRGGEAHPEGARTHPKGAHTHPKGGRTHPEGVPMHPEGVPMHPEGGATHPEGGHAHPEGGHAHPEGGGGHGGDARARPRSAQAPLEVALIRPEGACAHRGFALARSRRAHAHPGGGREIPRDGGAHAGGEPTCARKAKAPPGVYALRDATGPLSAAQAPPMREHTRGITKIEAALRKTTARRTVGELSVRTRRVESASQGAYRTASATQTVVVNWRLLEIVREMGLQAYLAVSLVLTPFVLGLAALVHLVFDGASTLPGSLVAFVGCMGFAAGACRLLCREIISHWNKFRRPVLEWDGRRLWLAGKSYARESITQFRVLRAPSAEGTHFRIAAELSDGTTEELARDIVRERDAEWLVELLETTDSSTKKALRR